MKDEITERKHIQSIPTYLMINQYVKEISKSIKSNDDVPVEISVPVERCPMPSHKGNTIDVYV